MTSPTIDLDTLNDLFENQKKPDDILSSFFDDDSALSTTLSNEQKSTNNLYSNDDFSFNPTDKTTVKTKQNIVYFVLPVVFEIAALYITVSFFLSDL